ncbi:hypothetical protein ONS96_008308 [Cadophora gregata f. sp. sojae]|nr:hypothetical protein ONS96_008308 [Cadophora gregata f. sp. sojae]
MAVNKAAEALSILCHLPDFNEELFIQLGEPLDTFTCFPNLPTELRIKIWHLSFPRGREFSIALELIHHHAGYSIHKLGKAAETKCNNAKAQLPATLFVNRESRRETLSNYVIILPEDFLGHKVKFGGDYGGSPPLCFNPHLGTPYVTLPSLKHIMSREWFGYLGEAYPELLDMIKHLKVREWICDYDDQVESFYDDWGELHREEYLNQFLNLTSLEEVTFMQSSRTYNSESPDLRRDYSQFLVDYLEEHKYDFGGVPPTFEFREEKRHAHAH